MYLYVTSDQIGSQTGGGVVTFNELESLKQLGPTDVINPPSLEDPFQSDLLALAEYKRKGQKYKLAHFYAGTFSNLVTALKEDGTKVTYTCAAHDVELSKQAHAYMGLPFTYPHLVNADLFKQYIKGYQEADLVISPSSHSEQVLLAQGISRINIIPHGCYPSNGIKPFPSKFSVGYLGQPGADKGLLYLIEAWALLNYNDSILIISGRDTEHLLPWARSKGKGNIHLTGFIKTISQLYNSCSVYVQPSVTEGFGIEVLEAMSYGRPVICSSGAGASDCIADNGQVVPSRNPKAIAEAINNYKRDYGMMKFHGAKGLEAAHNYSWDSIREQYKYVWTNV